MRRYVHITLITTLLAVLAAAPGSAANPNALQVTNFQLASSVQHSTASTHCTVTFNIGWSPAYRRDLYVVLVDTQDQDLAADLVFATEQTTSTSVSIGYHRATVDSLHAELRIWNARKGTYGRTITSSQSSALYYTDPDDCSAYVFTPN